MTDPFAGANDTVHDSHYRVRADEHQQQGFGISRYVFTPDVSADEAQPSIGYFVFVLAWFTAFDRYRRYLGSFQKPVLDRVQEEDLETRLDREGSLVGLGNLVERPTLEIRVAAVQDPEIALIHADRLPIDFSVLVVSGTAVRA
jgi:hypothetical protein